MRTAGRSAFAPKIFLSICLVVVHAISINKYEGKSQVGCRPKYEVSPYLVNVRELVVGTTIVRRPIANPPPP